MDSTEKEGFTEQKSGGPHYDKPTEKLFAIRLQAQKETMVKIAQGMHIDETLQRDEFINIVHREFNSACTDLWNEHVKPWASELYGKHR